jgi:proliferating cell nuclear antigen
MGKLLKVQTAEGYTIKMLADLLQNNIKTACLLVSEKNIKLTMYNSVRSVCFSFTLEAENFQIYKFKSVNSLYLGLNLSHFYKMIKSIKKKDSIILFIDEAHPSDLGIKVIPKENNRITTSYIKIQNIQNLDIALPTGYNNPIIVQSNEFQKMCKDMAAISQSVKVTAHKYNIKFFSDAGSVYSREVSFGEMDSDSDEEEDEEFELYEDEFNMESFSKIVKLAGLGNNIQLFAKKNLPMHFKSTVGQLGKISIYIKSKNLINADNLPPNISM